MTRRPRFVDLARACFSARTAGGQNVLRAVVGAYVDAADLYAERLRMEREQRDRR